MPRLRIGNKPSRYNRSMDQKQVRLTEYAKAAG
jgi:hypothetical protein